MYFASDMFAVSKPQQALHKAIVFNVNLTENCIVSTGKNCGDVMYYFCIGPLQSWPKRQALVGVPQHKVRQGHK